MFVLPKCLPYPILEYSAIGVVGDRIRLSRHDVCRGEVVRTSQLAILPIAKLVNASPDPRCIRDCIVD